MGKFINLTGQRFGKLTVIKRAEEYVSPKGQRGIQWLCECDCEDKNQIIVRGSNLKSGLTNSCGCYKIEKQKQYNEYDLKSHNYGIGYLDDGTEFYFDLEDYNKIKDIKWKKDKDGYIVSNYIDKDSGKTKQYKMHRLITDCPDDLIPDHVYGENTRNDNRKSNLRICTEQENHINRKISTNNTSGVTGVHWYNKTQRWRAVIYYHNKKIHLGSFENFEDAVLARKNAEKEYFGEFKYKGKK